MTDRVDGSAAHETPLESWKEIAAYLQRDARTAKRWETSEGLPVHRHLHKSRSSVHAYPSELNAWRTDREPAAESTRSPWLRPVAGFGWTIVIALALVMAGLTEYWELVPELSHRPDERPRSKLRVRFVDVERFEGYRFRELHKKAKAVREAMNDPDPRLVFRNVAGDGTRDFAVVRAFDKWAALDRETEFSDKFEEVHGQGSWRRALMEVEESIARGETELHELIPELSAPPLATAGE